MTKERIDWIDGAKGLGMLLIMCGHTIFPEVITKEMYTFHVPLFFFLSGYLFVYKKYDNFDEFLKSKFNSLVKPYFYFSMINYLYWLLFARFHSLTFYKFTGTKDVWRSLIAMVYDMRATPFAFYNAPLWFVTCLFVSEIFLYFIITNTKNRIKFIGLILIIFSFVGYFYNTEIKGLQIWNLDVSLTAVVFLGLGYLAKVFSPYLDRILRLILFPIFALANYYIGYYNIRVDMFGMQYGNYFSFYLSALFGIAAILSLNKIIAKSKLLRFIGKNSIVYLACHQFMFFPIIEKILLNLHIFSGQDFKSMFLFGITTTAIALALIAPVIHIIKRYFPFILGKKVSAKLS